MKNWNGKLKAVTFSYDDGNDLDIRLAELFNKYNVKCTFNINSGMQTAAKVSVLKDKNGEEFTFKRLNYNQLKDVYKGHEIASHALTHANLVNLDYEGIVNEIAMDKMFLEGWFDRKITGFAYPYGAFNDMSVKALEACDIKYARTVISNYSFEPQKDLLRFEPTCHHDDPRMFELIDDFKALKTDTPKIFYIWGHSYEFGIQKNWDYMEEILKLLTDSEDIFFGTNEEVLLG